MSIALISDVRKQVYGLVVDKKAYTWAEACLLVPEEYRDQLDAITFGKPDTIQRNGNDWVAKAKTGAQLPPIEGFTAYAEKEVSFRINEVANDALVVDKIKGIEVETPIGLRISVSKVTIGIDKEGNFLLTGTKFLVLTVTAIISPKGKYLGWRLGK